MGSNCCQVAWSYRDAVYTDKVIREKADFPAHLFEYITGITLGELAGFISTDIENNYMHGVVALLVWSLVPLGVELITLKSVTLRGWFDGKGTVMIKEGKVMEKNLKKERYTVDELLEQLRTKSVFNPAEVEFAMLEASGELSVMLKKRISRLPPSTLVFKLHLNRLHRLLSWTVISWKSRSQQ